MKYEVKARFTFGASFFVEADNPAQAKEIIKAGVKAQGSIISAETPSGSIEYALENNTEMNLGRVRAAEKTAVKVEVTPETSVEADPEVAV